MNEPNIFTFLGYAMGIHPPGLKDLELYLKTYHHTALAHAKTVLMFKDKGYEGMIGSSIAFSPAYAASNDKKDLDALNNYYQMIHWWQFDPYFKGSYPKKAVKYYKEQGILPEIDKEDLELLKKSAELVDFIGINYYQTKTVAYNPLDGATLQGLNTSGKKGTQKENGIPGLYKEVKNEDLEYTDWDWAIDPDGLRYGMVELKERYNLPIIISENGLGAFDKLKNDKINDDYRIDYIRKHLVSCNQAIKEGVNLISYCTWSFTDLLSWLNGYQKRYGFVYINFENDLQRVKKESFDWYKNVIATKGESLFNE
jgi:6-phospho-beta-glucosidase